MKCYYHTDTDAVAICKNCQRALCPGCAADVNATACRNRCEQQVAAINEVIERSKTAYQKTSGAYARNALVFALMGLTLCVVGALTWPTGVVMVGLGVIMFVGAALSYGTSRKIGQIGP
jgi:hypothetical protein